VTLKRTPMPARRTPLARTPLQRSGWAQVDRKPAPTVPVPRKPTGEAYARRTVAARSGGVCERCDAARAAHWHHRQNRSQGGRWEPANGLHLCARCHHYVTVNPAASEAPGWTVPRGLDPAAVAVRLALHGLVLLTPDGGYAATEGVAA
jgi:hypothetical protein